MSPWIALCTVAVAALLAAEAQLSRDRSSRDGGSKSARSPTAASHITVWHRLQWIAKPVAAACYVGFALSAGALGSAYGRGVLVALALSFLGDVLLIPRERPTILRLGILAFLMAHVAYVAAFLIRGVVPQAAGLAALVAMWPAALVYIWLRPHVPDSFKVAVRLYVVVISVMLVAAAGTVAAAADLRILAGALLFWLSDLGVARQRFVKASPWNRAWGLPLYFLAQFLLASTVG